MFLATENLLGHSEWDSRCAERFRWPSSA